MHLGGKALGGAGLVMTEMVCVSADGRITPGCAGMYAPEHGTGAWRRITEFVHAQSGGEDRAPARSLRPEGLDPAHVGGHRPAAARRATGRSARRSPLPYLEGVNQVPRELSLAEMKQIKDQFVAGAAAADAAGFDLLELHCAHGYLLSSFISPVSNNRTDDYGGSLAARLRYPLEVFAAMRAVWPAAKPMTVRISATDWVPGGITGAGGGGDRGGFKAAGADAIDVSTGQVTPDEQPAFGRSYQTPFADAIRNQTGIATVAVGVISSYDDVNSIILAGRADLCALGRAHLYDPNWTAARGGGAGLRRSRGGLAGAVAGRQPAAAERPDRRTSPAARTDPAG